MRTDVALHVATPHNLNLRHMAANTRAPSHSSPTNIRRHPFAVTIKRFRDGDTFTGYVQCNHCLGVQQTTIRLKRIDSYELGTSDDSMAKDFAEQLTTIWSGKTGYIATSINTVDKYGRTLADVITDEGDLSDWLVQKHFAWYGVNSSAPKGFQPAPYSDNSTVPP